MFIAMTEKRKILWKYWIEQIVLHVFCGPDIKIIFVFMKKYVSQQIVLHVCWSEPVKSWEVRQTKPPPAHAEIFLQEVCNSNIYSLVRIEATCHSQPHLKAVIRQPTFSSKKQSCLHRLPCPSSWEEKEPLSRSTFLAHWSQQIEV
jgi:hypothetical protein